MMTDNPARRLLRIIEQGRDYEYSNLCREVWANILNVDEENDGYLLEKNER